MALDILIVDDEADIRHLVSDILKDEGFTTREAADGNTAITEIRSKKPDLVILDVWLNDSRFDGIQLLDIIQEQKANIPTIMISGHGTVETAVKALKRGAYDFLEKPFTADRLITAVQKALEYSGLKRDNQWLKEENKLGRLMGQSTITPHLKTEIERLALTNSRVLISGPKGSHKIHAARRLHDLSSRAAGPFVVYTFPAVVNTSVSQKDAEDLGTKVAIDLFGEESKDHQKISGHVGLLEQANNGTLVLQHIECAPLAVQAKLVKALHDNIFTRQNGQTKLPLSTRIITLGTDPKKAMENRTLREDLYYRLAVTTLDIPSLMDHKEDIPRVASLILKETARFLGMPPKPLSRQTQEVLRQHTWTADIFELRHGIEGLLFHPAYTQVAEISPLLLNLGSPSLELVPPQTPSGEKNPPPVEIFSPEEKAVSQSSSVVQLPTSRETPDDARAMKKNLGMPSTQDISVETPSLASLCQLHLREAREQFERFYLMQVIQSCHGNVSKTAHFVGMERSALHRKLKSLGLSRGEEENNHQSDHNALDVKHFKPTGT